jgi:hypothetical protein
MPNFNQHLLQSPSLVLQYDSMLLSERSSPADTTLRSTAEFPSLANISSSSSRNSPELHARRTLSIADVIQAERQKRLQQIKDNAKQAAERTQSQPSMFTTPQRPSGMNGSLFSQYIHI